MRLLRGAVLGYLAAALLGCLFQRHLIYYPSVDEVEAPAAAMLDGLREVDLLSADGVPLKAWHWPGREPRTLVVFHGNAGDRSDRIPWMAALRRTGAGVLMIDYRGYGGSGGEPSENGLYLDGEAAVDWLHTRSEGPLVYVGESLGAAVAVELALRRPPQALILQAPFTSLPEVAAAHWPLFPMDLILWDRYESIRKMELLSCPVMVIHGGEDRTVPPSMGRELIRLAPGRKEWLEVPGADHNDPLWDMVPDYAERIARFLAISP